MKTLSFFNAKGGVGKSLHTVLFASYLRYYLGANVAVVDLENPHPRIAEERQTEERLLQDPKSCLGRYMAKHLPTKSPYDIFNLSGLAPKYTREYLSDLQNRAWKFVSERNYDYAVFDFPAMFMEFSPAFALIGSGLIDLTAIPVDVASATRKEGILTAELIRKNEQKVVIFWNNVSSEDIKRPGYLDSGETLFQKYGFEFMPERIKTFQKAKRDSDDMLFVKSTVCWPERYVEMACPELPKLYANLQRKLDSF